MSESHLLRAQLEALAEGDVDEPTRDAWFDHLSTCSRCFEAFDEEWEIRLPGGFRISEIEAGITEEMPPEVADRVESHLFRRVRVADLCSSASWFATTGFLEVVLCLLRPLVEFDRRQDQLQEADN